MTDLRISVSDDLKSFIKERADELEMSCSEYIRTLAYLDISVQRYQNLVDYVFMTYDRINDMQNRLNMTAIPLQKLEM